MNLYINTLGEFDIKANEQSVLKVSNRSYKILRLFEYFITFRNKKLLPETIINNLFSESESDDPKNMLRTQIFRLRKVIKIFLPAELDECKYLNLNFNNGYYSLEIGENVTIDIDEFENLKKQADYESSNNIENAIEFYYKSIKLYKGLYLSDIAYEVWLVPTRNYYQRLYLKTLNKLIELLKLKQENESIISLCEEALLYEQYEESIHLNLLEAMLELGKCKAAMNHYNYAFNMLEKEMNIRPSPQFASFPKKIQNYYKYHEDIDSSSVNKSLEYEVKEGAICCDFQDFKFIYNIQKRNSMRNNQSDYLGIITFNRRGNNQLEFDKLNNYKKTWRKILENSLRKGDVFTFWNGNQILMILYDVKNDGIEVIKNRIKRMLVEYAQISSDKINMNFQPLK